MMHLFINALAASAGGGLTYIRNVIPHLAAASGVRVTVALSPSLAEEFQRFPNVDCVALEVSGVRRFWFEQSELPGMIRRCGADVLLSTGNFALRKSPVPQILLSRNSIYTSDDFYRDLLLRHEYKAWVDTHLRAAFAKRSIAWADITVAPSEAFAAELKRWTGKSVLAVHHGFDREEFTRDAGPLAGEVEEALGAAENSLKLLFVSHYNYYRNFETLIRALPLLRERLAGHPVRLLLTCRLAAGANPGAYDPHGAASLVKELGVKDVVIQLGAIPYGQLHQVYRRADIYVTSAYTETFAHPLVEAMASGLPVVASDLAVHREICGEAAVYFPRFSPDALAERVVQLAGSPETVRRMVALGQKRAGEFSWEAHVSSILRLARGLISAKPQGVGTNVGS